MSGVATKGAELGKSPSPARIETGKPIARNSQIIDETRRGFQKFYREDFEKAAEGKIFGTPLSKTEIRRICKHLLYCEQSCPFDAALFDAMEKCGLPKERRSDVYDLFAFNKFDGRPRNPETYELLKHHPKFGRAIRQVAERWKIEEAMLLRATCEWDELLLDNREYFGAEMLNSIQKRGIDPDDLREYSLSRENLDLLLQRPPHEVQVVLSRLSKMHCEQISQPLLGEIALCRTKNIDQIMQDAKLICEGNGFLLPEDGIYLSSRYQLLEIEKKMFKAKEEMNEKFWENLKKLLNVAEMNTQEIDALAWRIFARHPNEWGGMVHAIKEIKFREKSKSTVELFYRKEECIQKAETVCRALSIMAESKHFNFKEALRFGRLGEDGVKRAKIAKEIIYGAPACTEIECKKIAYSNPKNWKRIMLARAEIEREYPSLAKEKDETCFLARSFTGNWHEKMFEFSKIARKHRPNATDEICERDAVSRIKRELKEKGTFLAIDYTLESDSWEKLRGEYTDDWEKVKAAKGHMCLGWGEDGPHKCENGELTKDHIIPRVMGGMNNPCNIALRCSWHNCQKDKKVDFAELLKRLEEGANAYDMIIEIDFVAEDIANYAIEKGHKVPKQIQDYLEKVRIEKQQKQHDQMMVNIAPNLLRNSTMRH